MQIHTNLRYIYKLNNNNNNKNTVNLKILYTMLYLQFKLVHAI